MYGMDNGFAFLILLGDLNAKLYMRAFLLMINSLADIVQQTGTLCKRGGAAADPFKSEQEEATKPWIFP